MSEATRQVVTNSDLQTDWIPKFHTYQQSPPNFVVYYTLPENSHGSQKSVEFVDVFPFKKGVFSGSNR